MLFMVTIFDNYQLLKRSEISVPLVSHVVSCVLALLVNLSNYLALGKTSPITYPVIGHFKMIMISVLGSVIFQYESNSKAIMGIVIALGGVIAYTEIKRRSATTLSSTLEYAKVLDEEVDDVSSSGIQMPEKVSGVGISSSSSYCTIP